MITSDQEKLFVIDSNLTRRQLSEFSRIEIALTKKPILEQIAKLNMSLGGKGVRIQTPLGRVDQKIADSAQSSKGKVRDVQALLSSMASPELLDKLRQGKAKISTELFRIQKAAVKQERLELAEETGGLAKNKNSMFQLMYGDMRELGKQIGDNSIPMIFTDPPYEKKFLELYGELAKSAQRVLKPGASLVFFMGHFHEDEIKDILAIILI